MHEDYVNYVDAVVVTFWRMTNSMDAVALQLDDHQTDTFWNEYWSIMGKSSID
jgi:hypothetical protein